MFRLMKVSTGEWWSKTGNKWVKDEKKGSLWKRKSDLSNHLNYRRDDTNTPDDDIMVIEYELRPTTLFPFELFD